MSTHLGLKPFASLATLGRRFLCFGSNSRLSWPELIVRSDLGEYKGEVVAEYRPDLVVADLVVVEIKSVERLTLVHQAEMLT